MARIRTVKPEFWTDETMAELPRDVRLLFLGLLNHVDDEGRCVDNPRLIKAAVFPLDDDVTAEMVRRWLDELSTKARVVLYEASQRRFLQVVNFRKHQKIDRANDSKLPNPEDCNIITVAPAQRHFDEPSSNGRRVVVEPSSPDQGSGIGIRDLDQGSLLASEPSSKPLPSTSLVVATAPTRARNVVFDALLEVCGIEDARELGPNASAYGKSVNSLRKMAPGLSDEEIAEEVRVRATRYLMQFADCRITHTALVKHWPTLTRASEDLQSGKRRGQVADILDAGTQAIIAKYAEAER